MQREGDLPRRGHTKGLAAVAHGSAQHAAQHVVPPVTARCSAVCDGEGQRADVILWSRDTRGFEGVHPSPPPVLQAVKSTRAGLTWIGICGLGRQSLPQIRERCSDRKLMSESVTLKGAAIRG